MECGIDWENIGFEIIPGSKVLCYKFADEKWDTGNFLVGSSITLDSFATVLHYGQSCFEGLKAFRMKDGKIRLFRPKLNAERIARSCRACSLPAPPESLFLEAVQRAVQANIDYVPPFTSNGSMYVRPFVIGTEAQLGLNPAKTAQFLVIVNPVGDYYKGGMSTPARAVIKHGFDRAAPHGTGIYFVTKAMSSLVAITRPF